MAEIDLVELDKVLDAEPDAVAEKPVEAPADGDAPAKEEYFLEVDDRTRYKTREDAVKGAREAGARISQLSSLEKVAKQYELTTPEDVQAVFEDYLELREKLAKIEAAKATPDAPKKPADPETLTPEEQKAEEWLRAKLGKLGATKDQIEAAVKEQNALAARLDRIESQTAESRQQRDAEAVQDGQSYLGTLLEKDGIKGISDEDRAVVDDFIAAHIARGSYNKKGELVRDSAVDRFYNHGPKARTTVLDEAYKTYKRLFLTPAKADDAAKLQAAKGKAGALKPAPVKPAAAAVGSDKPKTMQEANAAAIARFRQVSKEKGITLGPDWNE